MTEAELAKNMQSPRFRIEESGMYSIVSKTKDSHGKNISKFEPFRPLYNQKLINYNIYDLGVRRLLIPKARRGGVSTDINLCQLDFCLNTRDFHARIVDMSEDDAKDKLVNRVQRAYNNLASQINTGLEVGTQSGKEIAWSN